MMLSEAIEAVAKMVAAYPNGGSQAGKSYIGTMAALLCEYPRIVAHQCADPLHGVTRTTKFLPTVAEVVEFCEPLVGSMRGRVDKEDEIRAQLEERARFEAEERAPLDERRATVDRVRADMAAAGMPIFGDRNHDRRFTPEAVKKKLGITDEQWNAIPNAPQDQGYWQGLRAADLTKEPSTFKPLGDATRAAEEREWHDYLADR